MKLDNFYLASYDDRDIDHKTVVIEICNDTDGRKYLGDLQYYIASINQGKKDYYLNEAYIAYYNDEPVGFISIKGVKDEYHISYGIRPNKRGEYLGALLLQEFSEKLFEDYKSLESLTLMINDLNTGSIKTANLAGYEKVNATKYQQKR